MIKLQQYRDPWISEKVYDFIGFYPREFYCLDNFSSFKVSYQETLYSSAEEAYQAQKFINTAPEIYELIKSSPSAHDAQRIARDNQHLQRDDWDEVKLNIMEEILTAKVNQHPYVAKKLLQTKDYLIVEDSPYDSYWGCGSERNGKNQLGRLWMKIREQLKAKNSKTTKQTEA